VRTGGCRSRTSSRRAAGNEEGACGTLGWAGGGRSTPVDNELTGEEAVTGETHAPGVAADGSSSKVLPHIQRKMTVQFTDSNGNREGQWRPMMVSRGGQLRAEQELESASCGLFIGAREVVGDCECGSRNHGWKRWLPPHFARQARGLDAAIQTLPLIGGPHRFNFYQIFQNSLNL
jgi:hypothetical protein